MARGRSRSGTIESLVAQAREVAAEGGKEIVITGVNIGDFGKNTGDRFIDLLRAFDEIKEIERYRISSIEPDLLTDEIIEFCAQSRAFMPHFPASAARHGNGAVGAEVVAAVLHLQPVAGAVATLARRAELANVLMWRNSHLLLVVLQPAVHIVGDVEFLLAAEHDVHTVDGGDFLTFQLCVAPGHHHERVGIALDKSTNVLTAFFVGKFSHTASVHHAHRRHVAILRRGDAPLGKQCTDCSRFREVEFATQSFNFYRLFLFFRHES